jgi:hypothetical protein
VQVYHSNHHGSDTSGYAPLLNALRPQFAVISVGIGGTNGDNTKIGFTTVNGVRVRKPGDPISAFHLPNEGSLIRMAQAGVQAIYMTSLGETENDDLTEAISLTNNRNISADVVDNDQNDVMLTSDGNSFSFHGAKIDGTKFSDVHRIQSANH